MFDGHTNVSRPYTNDYKRMVVELYFFSFIGIFTAINLLFILHLKFMKVIKSKI